MSSSASSAAKAESKPSSSSSDSCAGYCARIILAVWMSFSFLGDSLVRKGLAAAYDGGAKKDWCRE